MTDRITINQLPAVVTPNRAYELAVMLAGATERMSVGQILDLLIGTAPGTLDMLDEIAAAIGNDENFAATVATGLAARLEKTQNLADLSDPASARANLGLIDGSGRLLAALIRPGQVVQEVVATTATNDITTSSSFVGTSLQGDITPMFSNSVVEAIAFVPKPIVSRISGSGTIRVGSFRIRNISDGVDGPQSSFGRTMDAASAVAAPSFAPVVCMMRYLVNSTATRTFRLQFSSITAIDQEVQTRANEDILTLTLREIRQ